MYAALFGILRACDAPPSAFVVVTLFFTVVGLGQKLLFKGRRPGIASIIVGACFFVGLYMFYEAAFGVAAREHFFAPYDPVEGAFCGAILGYLVGLPISGVLLVIGMLRNRQRRFKGPEQAEKAST